MSLDIQVENQNGGLIQKIILDGKLDANTVGHLEEYLKVTWQLGEVVIFDLEKLSYISSAGVRIILQTRKILDERKGKTVVVKIQPQVRRVFDILKAMPDTSIFKDDEELDNYLEYIQNIKQEKN